MCPSVGDGNFRGQFRPDRQDHDVRDLGSCHPSVLDGGNSCLVAFAGPYGQPVALCLPAPEAVPQPPSVRVESPIAGVYRTAVLIWRFSLSPKVNVKAVRPGRPKLRLDFAHMEAAILAHPETGAGQGN